MTTKALAVFASVLLSGLAFMPYEAGAAQPAQNSFPPIGNDSNGPEFLLTLGPNGNNSLVLFPGSTSQGPYDGIEDTYIGVWNNSGKSVPNVALSATSIPIFGFDGDGIGSNDPTGYGGPGVSFSNINAAQTAGTVNFAGGLAPDGTAYFALEEALSFNANTGVVVGLAFAPAPGPIPGAGLLSYLGLGAIGLVSRRRVFRSWIAKRLGRTAVAT